MGYHRMRVLLWVLLLAGCVQDGGQPGEAPVNREAQAQAHTELGLGYYELRKYQFAIEELNVALDAVANYIPALNGLALVYMGMEDDPKAESYFKRALRQDKRSPVTLNNYGQFLCARSRPQEGLQQLLAAASDPLYDTQDIAFKNAGQCARRAGDLNKAEEYFRQAVMRNPRQIQALFNLADLRHMKNDSAQAKVYLDRAMQGVESPGPEILWLAARTARDLGETEAFNRYATDLRRKFPDAPETRALTEGRYQ